MSRSPLEVMSLELARAIADTRYWFVIGGQAVRCFAPYRPSRDADLGVAHAKDLRSLVAQLRRHGRVQILERSADTVHLTLEGIDVSIFVLPELLPHVAENALTVTGVLATKTHAILDRGTRRDFFDLYVMLELHGLGMLQCLEALQQVYATEVNHGLVLRALCYFDDANSEPALPGEGKSDWQQVKSFFAQAVAALIVPPRLPLAIQSRVVDVHPKPGAPSADRSQRAPPRSGKARSRSSSTRQQSKGRD